MVSFDARSKDPILTLQDVHMRFGGVTALKGIHYQVPRGIVQSIIGPNGAGKTTLLNCISGVLHPSEGVISFLGRSVESEPPHRIAALGMSRTFQHVALFPRMSVLENVMVGRHVRTRSGFWAVGLRTPTMRREEAAIGREAKAWLDFVGLADAAHLEAGALPLGKQKILEIARALATDPALLLLDEPAGGLNARETEELGELIQRIQARGITVILVEHDMNLVMSVSERILVLYYGQPLASGAPDEIKEDPQVIQAYLGDEWAPEEGKPIMNGRF
ncbi:amino acid/amide ABC transporter ATP-binding protein 1, HAAT family [Desulfacinum hydrothermale DSM 13146]|uniref:Amino acid/amide ABC transporter ATP-binding protein 1, HAAT family n=1 Tax=Desulfacinum hydrothermale DSM 13146 TaxID=1121390 RepID=A0A1W1XAN9_9BACT|nr:ABC transporter ATP-binding protein [Desulfacinum hydrothermale]SMC20910.1 amino acid/amide ABC transporter ATP-binding protein 1, HAAT family [Desulfacinum hydrothermale DSM 13146]